MIPSIASDLGVTVELINISVLAYMIAQVSLLSPPKPFMHHADIRHSNRQGVSPSFFGAICDVLGRRPTYIVSFIM